MTKIILVRHGHVEGISPERFRGRADLLLTAEGRRQTEAVASRIQVSWNPATVGSASTSSMRAEPWTYRNPAGKLSTSVTPTTGPLSTLVTVMVYGTS